MSTDGVKKPVEPGLSPPPVACATWFIQMPAETPVMRLLSARTTEYPTWQVELVFELKLSRASMKYRLLASSVNVVPV